MKYLVIFCGIFLIGCSSIPLKDGFPPELPANDCSVEHRKDGDYYWICLDGKWILWGKDVR